MNDIQQTSNNYKFTMDYISNVSNKEALKSKIHDIHNYLRNNGAGYGMNALKVFNIFYGLKKIEETGMLNKVSLKRPECEFSFLLATALKGEHEVLASLIFTDVLNSIYESDLKDFLFYEIPKNIKGVVFAGLLKEIDSITTIERTCNCQLSGKIYEYFIGRDATAISELGAYFTNNHITDFICNEIQPSIKEDSSIHSMIDMFGGSGGFTTGYINYLRNHYGTSIDWATQLSNVYHYDINEDVIKTAALEFFCLTGVLPNMNNLRYKNSFVDEFYGSDNKPQKFHYILTNPPYGGDKSKKSDGQVKRDKIKDFIKKELKSLTDKDVIERRTRQLKDIERQDKLEKVENEKAKVSLKTCSQRIKRFAKEHNLKANDKEACSLILMMELLEEGGTAVGVLKEGVFFNSLYKDLRKCLVENFNVRKIISIPQDQFENTSTKTSIVVFDNCKDKTYQIQFSELIVDKYDDDVFEEIDGDVVLIENKGDVIHVYEKETVVATCTEVVATNFSLSQGDYVTENIVVNNGYKLVPLSDVCEFGKKSKRLASYGSPNGLYNFYTSSETVKKCDVVDYKEEYIIIGTGGNSCLHIAKNFSCSGDVLLLKTNDVLISNFYYYCILQGLWSCLTKKMTKFSTIKHVTKSMLNDFQVPVPSSHATKIECNNAIDNILLMYISKDELHKQLCSTEESILDTIRKYSNTFSQKSLKELCKFKDGYNFYRKDMDGTKCYVQGKNLPLLKVGEKINDYVIVNDKFKNYMAYKNDILVSVTGTCGRLIKVSVDKAYYIHGLIKLYDIVDVHPDYLYYFMTEKFSAEYLDTITNKTIVSFMKLDTLKELMIGIPTQEVMVKLMQMFDKVRNVRDELAITDEKLTVSIEQLVRKIVVKM